MPSREEKIAFIQQKLASQGAGAPAPSSSSGPKSREEKLAFIKSKVEEKPEESSGIIDTIIGAAKVVDSYTGAPARAAIGAAQDGKNPISAGWNQLGEDPSTAPTGKDIVMKAGVPDTRKLIRTAEEDRKHDQQFNPNLVATKKYKDIYAFSPADMAGTAMEFAADPTNIVPVGAVLKGATSTAKFAGKTGLEGAKVAGKGAINVASKVPGAGAVGTTAQVIGDGVENTAKAIKKMFAPTQASDFKDLQAIATKNGIDVAKLPEAIEFGENSFISRASRNRAEGVLGEEHLKKFDQALEEVEDATKRKISQIGGGSVPGAIEAGEMIRKGYDEGVDKIFDSVGMTHNKVMQAIPGLPLSPKSVEQIESKLLGMERWAKGRQARGFTDAQRTQATQVLRAIEATRAGNGSYKQTLETLRDIGEVAYKSQNVLADIPPDIAKFRELYKTINEGLITTVRQSAGDEVAEELLQSNKTITEFFSDKSLIAPVIGNKNMGPDKVFSALIENGDVAKIRSLKKILPPETFQKLKGAFLASQIKRTADGRFTFKSLHNNLRSYKDTLGEILDAQEITELNELIRLGDRFGNPVLSTSGTGASGLFRNITEGIKSGVESDTVIGLLKDSARNRTAKKAIAETAESTAEVATETAETLAKESPKLKSTKTLTRIAQFSPAILRALSIPKNDDGTYTEPRGEKKWSADGIVKIMDHDKTISSEKLSELAATPKGRKILISASDLKPGSKAMNQLLKGIKGAK